MRRNLKHGGEEEKRKLKNTCYIKADRTARCGADHKEGTGEMRRKKYAWKYTLE